MNWFKKHADAVSVIGALVIAVWVMLGTTHGVEMRLSKDINEVRNELVKIETVMILKGIAPQEIFAAHEEARR